jgi:hypothetical protein
VSLDVGPLSQTVVGARSYYVKWAGATHFELHRWDDDAIYLVEDHSLAPNPPYAFSPGVWMNRYMAVGDRIVASRNHALHYDANCMLGILQDFPYTTILERRMTMDFAGDVGNQDTIVLRYEYQDDSTPSHMLFERFYYSAEWGWVRWEAYDAQGTLRQLSEFNTKAGAPTSPGTACVETNPPR